MMRTTKPYIIAEMGVNFYDTKGYGYYSIGGGEALY